MSCAICYVINKQNTKQKTTRRFDGHMFSKLCNINVSIYTRFAKTMTFFKRINSPGVGSDYGTFQQRAGITCADFRYDQDYVSITGAKE